MACRSLAEFLEVLADGRELVRIGAEVDPAGELAEIVRRAGRAAGPALLFDRVRGCSLPIVANLLGSEARACRALGVGRIEELSERVDSLVRQAGPQGWLERLKLAPEQPVAERFRAKPVRTAACQQIVRLGHDIDLSTLAVLGCWPDETQRLLTAALLVSADAAGLRQVTPCRLQLVDRIRLAIVDEGPGDWTRRWQAARQAGQRLSVALILGGDPAYAFGAALPLDAGLDGYARLGMVRGAPLETVRCRSHALDVPGDCDLVLEGTLDPAAGLQAVTIGSRAGPYYRAALEAPVLQIEALTQRSSAALPAIIGTASEAAVLRKAVERMLLPIVRAAIPELVDYALPAWGGERFAFLAIRKSVPLQARRAASALWGLAALESLKFVVIVDEEVDVHDAGQVWSRVAANVDPGRDAFVREGPGAADDHALAVPLWGRQLGLDATRKWSPEVDRPWPTQLATAAEVRELVDRRWGEYGL